jgi:putative flippase GtrA
VSVLYAAMAALGIGPYLAGAFAYLVAASTTWALNRKFTFRSAAPTRPRTQWTRFVISNAVGGAVNYGVFAGLIASQVPYLSEPGVAVAAGSIAGLAFNFTISRLYVFTP